MGGGTLVDGVAVVGGGSLVDGVTVVGGGMLEGGGGKDVGGGTLVQGVKVGGGGGTLVGHCIGVGRWKMIAPVASRTAKEPPAVLETTSEQALTPAASYVPDSCPRIEASIFHPAIVEHKVAVLRPACTCDTCGTPRTPKMSAT